MRKEEQSEREEEGKESEMGWRGREGACGDGDVGPCYALDTFNAFV
jgi:hypothetical protein